jgi:hypothetical protein
VCEDCDAASAHDRTQRSNSQAGGSGANLTYAEGPATKPGG